MTTVLITAIGSFSAEAVIRRSREMGFYIIGCDIYPEEWVASSKDVDVFYRAPYATDSREYLSFLTELCRREQVDFVVPLTDAEVDVLNGLPAAESGTGRSIGNAVVCISGEQTITLCRDKYRLWQFLEPLKLCRMIPSVRAGEIAGVTEVSYPAVLKPCDGRSSQGLFFIPDAEEMEYRLRQLKKQGRTGDYLVQPRVSGCVVTVDVVRDTDGVCCVCVPRRELLRTLNGAGTSVEVFFDEELEAQCRAIADALGICGCVNMEFIEEAEGSFVFLECNPRFAGGVAFSCEAGYDMIKNHFRCFMGDIPEQACQIEGGYIARRYTEYVMRKTT